MLDAEYYMPILQTNKKLDQADQILLVSLVLYFVEEDLVGFLNLNQEELVDKFFEFIENKKDVG